MSTVTDMTGLRPEQEGCGMTPFGLPARHHIATALDVARVARPGSAEKEDGEELAALMDRQRELTAGELRRIRALAGGLEPGSRWDDMWRYTMDWSAVHQGKVKSFPRPSREERWQEAFRY